MGEGNAEWSRGVRGVGRAGSGMRGDIAERRVTGMMWEGGWVSRWVWRACQLQRLAVTTPETTKGQTDHHSPHIGAAESQLSQ